MHPNLRRPPFLAAQPIRTIFATGLLVAASATPALAIPSPELVVGSLSSLSQLTALLSAIFGGGALALGSRMNAISRSEGSRARHAGHIVLACFAAAVLGFGSAIYAYQQGATRERNRLQQTLLRPTPKAAEGQTLDPLLKEIPYEKQILHPRGLSTDQAAKIIADVAEHRSQEWQILDIRESAETEMGSLAGAIKIRFPDLPQSHIDLANKTNLLICHNGNRSAETCEALAAKGIDCRFIAGGLEKWLAEGRRLDGSKARSVNDLRALPSFPSQTTLLDTERVHELVEKEGATFVDVRYAGEFASGHLPHAINLPIRPTPTSELAARISALPAKPIIAPCYDRRSCFYGEILGLTLARAGRDFRGRYTVPWEYFAPSKRPPHVEALLAAQNKTAWMRAGDALAAALAALTDKTGLAWAIVLMALASRLLVMPFSLKAERDQLATHAIKDEVADLKTRLAGDPQRLARALRAVYKRAGLTPGRNLVALLFLPVLALAVDAAIQVAQAKPSQFFWIGDLAHSDPWQSLPAVFAALIGIYLQIAFVNSRRQAAIVWFLAVPLLFAAAAILPAAAGLYMASSAALLLVQRFFVSGLPGWSTLKASAMHAHQRIAMARLNTPGVISLSDANALQDAGNKAKRLAQLNAAGLPVPPGLVLTPEFLANFSSVNDGCRRARVKAIWRYFGKRPLAVRSSGALEDGNAMSFAGVFESILDCDQANLADAILKVCASFGDANASAYLEGAGGHPGHVLIQPMVNARYAGVLFTEAIEEPGQMQIEMVEGTGDKLVSGLATPQAFRVGRISGAISGKTTPPIDLAPLVSLAHRVEAVYGCPQDIEWAFDGARYVILQARDVTANLGDVCEREERRRLVQRLSAHQQKLHANTPIFERDDVAELLPRPTQSSLSLLDDMWRSGGSVDLALRSLGFDAAFSEDGPPLHTTVFGRLYTDVTVQAQCTPQISRFAISRLERSLPDVERNFRDNFLPTFVAQTRLLQATDFNRLATNELQNAFFSVRRRFIEETHAEVSRVNIAAQFAIDRARDALLENGYDPAAHLSGAGATELEQRLTDALSDAGRGSVNTLNDLIGHRAALDYELADPRYSEGQQLIARAQRLVDAHGRAPLAPHSNAETPAAQILPPAIADKIALANSLQTLKEDAKHHALRELAVLRNILLALDERYVLSGSIFHLTLDEIERLDAQNTEELAACAHARAITYRRYSKRLPLPGSLTLAHLEGLHGIDASDAKTASKGQRVSGSTDVMGRARVVSAIEAEEGRPIESLRDGEIIVAPFLHPEWLPELLRSGGAAVSIGGWLSHMAIVAREHGKALIVGADMLETIQTGSLIRLGADGHVEVLAPAGAAYASAAE
ncbi:MAG: PEP/pyruvate-binding domain-containing protein [Hyphomicrobiaceae bacterium]